MLVEPLALGSGSVHARFSVRLQRSGRLRSGLVPFSSGPRQLGQSAPEVMPATPIEKTATTRTRLTVFTMTTPARPA